MILNILFSWNGKVWSWLWSIQHHQIVAGHDNIRMHFSIQLSREFCYSITTIIIIIIFFFRVRSIQNSNFYFTWVWSLKKTLHLILLLAIPVIFYEGNRIVEYCCSLMRTLLLFSIQRYVTYVSTFYIHMHTHIYIYIYMCVCINTWNCMHQLKVVSD